MSAFSREPTTARGRRCHTPDERGVLADESARTAAEHIEREIPCELAVFGANGPTGRLLCRLALDEDHDVVAFTRHPDTFPFEHPRLECGGGDVHDAGAVAAAIDGTDAVVSTLGVPFAKTPISVYSGGSTNIIAGMHAAGIKRFVGVTSSAVAPHPEPLGGFVFEKILQPYVVNKLGKTVYDDMRRMESIVSDERPRVDHRSPVGVVRGIRLSPSTASRSTTSGIASRLGSTWPIASCAKRSGDTYVRSTIAVATPSAKPSMLKLIWQEGIRKQS